MLNLSYNKYLFYLKYLKFKIETFVPKNTIEFIIAHYNESFEYLKYLPKNQIITIYYKGDKNLILPKLFVKYQNCEIRKYRKRISLIFNSYNK